jgi:hypothetical protein
MRILSAYNAKTFKKYSGLLQQVEIKLDLDRLLT